MQAEAVGKIMLLLAIFSIVLLLMAAANLLTVRIQGMKNTMALRTLGLSVGASLYLVGTTGSLRDPQGPWSLVCTLPGALFFAGFLFAWTPRSVKERRDTGTMWALRVSTVGFAVAGIVVYLIYHFTSA